MSSQASLSLLEALLQKVANISARVYSAYLRARFLSRLFVLCVCQSTVPWRSVPHVGCRRKRIAVR